MSFHSYAQQYWSKRYDLDIGNDYGTMASDVADGVIVPLKSFCTNNTEDCMGLIKIDYQGNLLWKTILYDSLDFEHLEPMDIRNDSIFMNTSYIDTSYGIGYLIKTFDMEGADIGSFAYNFPSTPNRQSARELIVVGDRMYVNYSYRDTSDLKDKVNLRAYDLSWELLWEVHVPDNLMSVFYMNMEPTLDSGIVLTYTHIVQGEKRASIDRYNKYGEKLWTTQFQDGYGTLSNSVTITAHPDGSFFGTWWIDYFTGNPFKNSYPDILYKLDSNGVFVWQKMQQDKWENFNRIFIAQNGDIIGCGAAYNQPLNGPDVHEWRGGYVRRMNTDGQEIWDRRIIDSTGGSRVLFFYSGLELSNGDLMFIGIIDDTLPYYLHPDSYDAWVVKTDSNGCLTPGCQDTFQILVHSKEAPGYREPDIFGLLPNPFTERLVLGTLLGYPVPPGLYHAAVYDLQGKLVHAPMRINPDLLTEFDMSAQPVGMYVVQVFRDGAPIQALKALKE